jgi:hypothetical protein
MVATVIINRTTSAATLTDITSANTRASTSDDPSPGNSNPIPVPGAGQNFSFWVSTNLAVSVPPSTAIDNLRWYTDGANGFGAGVTATGNKTSTYVQASGTIGSTGLQLTTVLHTNLFSAAQDIFSYVSASPRTLDGSTSISNSNGFGDFMVYQIAVSTAAGAGPTPQETLTWLFDET